MFVFGGDLVFEFKTYERIQRKKIFREASSNFLFEKCCNNNNKSIKIEEEESTRRRRRGGRDIVKLNNTKEQNQINMNSKRNISSHKTLLLMTTLVLLIFLAVSIITVECHFKRTQYHEQGLHGPKSYKFGYTSGDYKNPQERHEVSDGYGHVKGYYSYVDAYGKHQVVHYEAHPKYGFKVYNYKSKAYNNGKRHYNS